MFGGLISMLRLYTDEQYETVVTKFSSNFHQAFSLLLACFVFYASHSTEIIKDKTNDIIIFIVGGLEIFYISCVVIDTCFRSEVKTTRLYSVVDVIAGFTS